MMRYRFDCPANQSTSEEKCSIRGGKFNIKKSHCNIHSTLRQRLETVKLLSKEHSISTLCRVLKVNRSTYYKFINHQESNRAKENAYIRSCILTLYAKYKKRLGAAKMRICLKNQYCINISVGRVYRLMKSMSFAKNDYCKAIYS